MWVFLLFLCLNVRFLKVEAQNQDGYYALPFGLSPVCFELLASYEESLFQRASSLGQNDTPLVLIPYLEDYKRTLSQAQITPSTVAENPNLIFKMIWRAVKYLSPVFAKVKQDPAQEDLRRLLGVLDTVHLPTMLDLEDFVEKIGILHNMFDLKPEEIIVGKLREIDTGASLSFEQALFIANSSLIFHHFHVTKDWLDFLEMEEVPKLPQGERNKSIRDISNIRKTLVELHDSTFNQNSMGGYPFMFTTRMENETDLKLALEEEIQEWVDVGGNARLVRAKIIKAAATCRNSSVYTLRETANFSKLKCHLDANHPYFLLHPVRKEMLSDAPEILLFHDVLLPREISFMEGKSDPFLPEKDKARLETEAKPSHIIQRLQRMLNLRVDAEEMGDFRLMVDDTGIYSKPTHDALSTDPNQLKAFSDILGTLYFSFWDAKLGGEVLFPDIPLIARQERGSMLYWENYNQDGRVDWRTFHGDCPVLLGRGVHWTVQVSLERNRMRRKCGLEQSN